MAYAPAVSRMYMMERAHHQPVMYFMYRATHSHQPATGGVDRARGSDSAVGAERRSSRHANQSVQGHKR